VEGGILFHRIKQGKEGLSKQVLKNQGSIRLNFRDIFAGSVFKGYSRYSNVDAQFKNVNDNRSFTVSFTYRFSKGKLKATGSRKSGGAGEEQNRVKGASN